MEFCTSAEILDFCLKNNIECSEEKAKLFDRMSDMLEEFNSHTNVTALKTKKDICFKHFIDSLGVLKYDIIKKGAKTVDIGCGAGFPGVPLAIACPEARVTLLDSLGKRMKWLEEILPQLDVRAQCVTARAEEAAAERRESYDYAVSRAVARLNILLELTAPYVKVGGAVLAMKGSAAREELAECTSAIKKLGLQLESVKEFSIDGASHAVIVLRKTAPTPKQSPRRYAKIKQSPL